MNDNRCRGRGPRQPSPRRARVAATIVALTGVALLTSACGGAAASSTSAEPSQYAQALAYSQCMRAHGVLNFPDPDSQGQLPPVQEGRNGASHQTITSAQQACQHLQSGGGAPGTAQQQQAKLAQALNFSKCMRAHGVPNYPDPSVGNGGIGYNLSAVNQSSPQYQAAQRTCQTSNGGRS